MYNMEQPLGDASAIAFAIACRETAKHTKICYSGEGADEFSADIICIATQKDTGRI